MKNVHFISPKKKEKETRSKKNKKKHENVNLENNKCPHGCKMTSPHTHIYLSGQERFREINFLLFFQLNVKYGGHY